MDTTQVVVLVYKFHGSLECYNFVGEKSRDDENKQTNELLEEVGNMFIK